MLSVQPAEGVEADSVTVPVADTYDPDAADEFETEEEASVDQVERRKENGGLANCLP